MARITIRVHPRAKQTRITGMIGSAYKLDLAAPPVDGKANDACIRYFADLAKVSRSQVRVIAGATSRTKIIEIEGVSQEVIEGKLHS